MGEQRGNKPAAANLSTGRVNQKLRTRDTLVSTAAELIRQGRSFSVGDVADLARVGRTTAYRYFPTHELLVAHAALYRVTRAELRPAGPPYHEAAPPAEKVAALVGASDSSIRDHEKEYRTMLRLSLEATPVSEQLVPHRTRFRQKNMTEALSGLEKTLGRARLEQLVAALCMFVGVEADVVMRDVCLLPADAARVVKLWAAQTLLRGAMAEAQAESAGDDAKRSGAGRRPGGKATGPSESREPLVEPAPAQGRTERREQ